MICKPKVRIMLFVILWISLMVEVKSTKIDTIEDDTHTIQEYPKKFFIPSYSIVFPLVQRKFKNRLANARHITTLIRKYLCPLPTSQSFRHAINGVDIADLLLTPNQQFLVVRDTNNWVFVYDIETGTTVRKFKASVEYHEISKLMLLDDESQDLFLWDNVGNVNVFQSIPHHTKIINGNFTPSAHPMEIYTVSADYQFLLAADCDVVRAWDLKSGNHCQTFYYPDLEHEDHEKFIHNVDHSSIAFLSVIGTEDCRWVVATRQTHDKFIIIVWNFQTGLIVERAVVLATSEREHFTSLMPDERGIVLRSEKNKFNIWNLPNMDKMLQFRSGRGYHRNAALAHSCVVGRRPDSSRYLICIGSQFAYEMEFWSCQPDFSHVERTHTIDWNRSFSSPNCRRCARGFTDGGRILITTYIYNCQATWCPVLIEFLDTETGKLYDGKKK